MAALRIHSTNDDVTTLGPGPALGLWVQGCAIGCSGCTSAPTWDQRGGVLAEVGDVARWMARSERRHLTISGGEPMDQAPALLELIDRARADRDWIVTCYSGYRLAALRHDHRPGTSDLLSRLDLLIDGPYVERRHAPLLWRASTNQQIHDLSGRVEIPVDRSAGVTYQGAPDGSGEFIGVFPEPRFLDRLTEHLATNGTPVVVTERPRPFPFPTNQEP
jgi:anaerobic ribonucleoside-triphosphate reductase activating protein